MTLESFALATRPNIGGELRTKMRAAEMASLVSDALLTHSSIDARHLFPGAGLCLAEARLHPTVMVDRSLLDTTSNELQRIENFPRIREVLGQLLGGWPAGLAEVLRILPVSLGELHAGPGTGLLCTATGRVGPHVNWGVSGQGFLTAGHVAPISGSVVSDMGGALLGTVLWSNDPASAPSTIGEVDVALVEFGGTLTATTGRTPVIVGAGQAVSVASTGNQADVFGFFSYVRFGSAQACYSECYATDTRITVSGDSGGLVEAGGDVVGMVIGGFTGRDMTMVQAISYQLSEIRRLSGYVVSL